MRELLKADKKSINGLLSILSPINIVVILVIIGAAAPVIYWGKDSFITVHDWLDSILPWYKMLQDNGLLLHLDSPTPVMGGMSTAYSMANTYNLTFLLYQFFDTFTAHTAGYVINILIGYTSMYLLLRHLFPDDSNAVVNKLVSLGYSLLPAIPSAWISLSSIPLFCYAFLYLSELDCRKVNIRVFLLLALPFLSGFVGAGFFILTIWFICTVVLWVQKKIINPNLTLGFFCMLAGYILVDLRLFYTMFILREPLNRNIMFFDKSIGQALADMLHDYLFGQYHVPIEAYKYVIPVIFVCFAFFTAFIFKKIISDEYRNEYRNIAHYCLFSLQLIGVSIIFQSISALYQTQFFSNLVNTVFPFMRGFNWGRFDWLNRIVLYVCFALALIAVTNTPQLFNQHKLKIERASRFFFRCVAYTIACLQIGYILTSSNMYNYFGPNTDRENSYRTGNITYNEFFAEDFFAAIKNDLNYNGEGAAAVGYHPSVLMYNGFSCIDGYNNSYPLIYMQSFRKIIEPQTITDPDYIEDFDGWSGRMYLYNDDKWAAPREKQPPIELHINTDAFRALGGVYILSRAELLNADNIDLTLYKYYSSEDSIYDIYVYRA